MSLLSRCILIVSAAICGGFFAFFGAGASRAIEPEQYSTGTVAFWFFAGVALTAPLWVPAVFPSRYPHSLKVCRRVCAFLLLFPTWLFGSIVAHNISRALTGLGATPIALAQGAALTLCCVVCLFVLLLPEFRRNANLTT
ncbi:hypothetical protein D3C85_1158840 [compost metagenome]